jgi:hypothetical protein
MIEINFDNCFGPLHCVCRTNIFRRGREKACLSDQLCLLRQGTNWNTANFVQWLLLKDVTRELKVHRGTTKLTTIYYLKCLLGLRDILHYFFRPHTGGALI